MSLFTSQIHPSWKKALEGKDSLLAQIEAKLVDMNYSPPPHLVMRALAQDLNSIKVVIFGQDPYPQESSAIGLAFAVNAQVKKLPGSLRNILREALDDVGENNKRSQDLSTWVDQGVLLLNRALTIGDGVSGSHMDIGWKIFTDELARILGERGVIAILWGKSASELKRHFLPDRFVTSAHPSPLSAHRGFLGSKPFSSVNRILQSYGKEPINW